jgi:hypothetical protein
MGDALTQGEWMKFFSDASKLRNVSDAGSTQLNLRMLMGNHLTEFWRYSGSLTVPPCNETVTWSVFKTPIELDESLLVSIRNSVLHINFRPPQPLNNRIVYKNFQEKSLILASGDSCCGAQTLKASASALITVHRTLVVVVFISFVAHIDQYRSRFFSIF